jgi:hypothetical protein
MKATLISGSVLALFLGLGLVEAQQIDKSATDAQSWVKASYVDGCPDTHPVDCDDGSCCPARMLCCGRKFPCCPSDKPWLCPSKSLCYKDEETAEAKCDGIVQRCGSRSLAQRSSVQVSSLLMAQEKKDGCRPYQHRDENGRCVDDPGVTHHGEGYEPRPGEQCWVVMLCLCREGQYPSGESCSPCSTNGKEVVCKPL